LTAVTDHIEAEPLPLSLKERAIGKRRYFTYGFFNSLSYAVLAEGVVILALLRLGGTELWVGAVSALMYVTLPFMLLGYYTIPRLGVSGTAGLFWFIRSCSAAFMIVAPWVSVSFGREAGLWCMFLGSLGFMLGRAGGLASFTGIITELTTQRDRGDLISSSFKIYQSGAILVTGLMAVFLGSDAPVHRYQWFFTIGLFSGVVASIALWRIPEAGLFRKTPRFSLRDELRWALATRGRRWFVAMMLAIPVVQGLMRTFIILVAKQGYGLTDQIVVLLVIVGMLGGVVASYSYGLFLDQLGSRPLLVLTGFVDVVVVALVVLLPEDFSPVMLGLIFFFSGYTNTALQAATQHYFISITTHTHQLSQGILTQGAGGLAGGLGLYLGGWALAHVKEVTAGSPDNLLHFRWFFGALLVLLLLRTLIFFKIPPLRSQGIRDSLNALFSPWDWRAIHAVKRAVSGQSEDEEARALAAMRRSTAGIYQEDLERYLRSPSFFVRARAMDALFLARPTRTLIEILEEDLRSNLYTTAHQAAYWLGTWKVESAVQDLREAILSPDFRLSGSAIHALVELDDRESLPVVEAAFITSDNPYLLIEAARALSLWGRLAHYRLLLHKYHLDIPPQAKDELSLSVARLLGLYDGFYRDLGMARSERAQLYREWQERFGSGDVEGLIDAMRAGEPRRFLLEQSLERQRDALQETFYTATQDFLARQSEEVLPEMAFLMTFLLLSPHGLHRVAPTQ
jgi:MFS family permease